MARRILLSQYEGAHLLDGCPPIGYHRQRVRERDERKLTLTLFGNPLRRVRFDALDVMPSPLGTSLPRDREERGAEVNNINLRKAHHNLLSHHLQVRASSAPEISPDAAIGAATRRVKRGSADHLLASVEEPAAEGVVAVSLCGVEGLEPLGVCRATDPARHSTIHRMRSEIKLLCSAQMPHSHESEQLGCTNPSWPRESLAAHEHTRTHTSWRLPLLRVKPVSGCGCSTMR